MRIISHQEAVKNFIQISFNESNREIHSIVSSFGSVYDPNFIVESESEAANDLALARIALAYPKINNLFDRKNAEKILLLINHFLTTHTGSDYAVNEVKIYYQLFIDELDSMREIPGTSIAGRLLQKWIKENIKHFLVTFGGKQTNIISPTLIQSMTILVIEHNSAMFWKDIKNNYRLN
jgi:hypothetical protein